MCAILASCVASCVNNVVCTHLRASGLNHAPRTYVCMVNHNDVDMDGMVCMRTLDLVLFGEVRM